MAPMILRSLLSTGGAMRMNGRLLSKPQLRQYHIPSRPAAPWPRSSFISRTYSSLPPDRSRPEDPSSEDPAAAAASSPRTSTPDDHPPATQPHLSSEGNPSSSPPPRTTPDHPPATPKFGRPDSAAPPGSSQDPNLPSWAESRRSQISVRFARFMDNLQNRYVSGLQTFNSLTGYDSIEAITANNSRLEKSLFSARAAMRAARQHYQDISTRQVGTQRDTATLLARKASWGHSDKNRFAELMDEDYRLEKEVAEASKALEEAEAAEQNLISEWVAGMSKQYYEHQVYSDRIRRASTWGTWGLMGVNVLLFLMLQFVAEPWRRGRLLGGMEERESKLFDRVEARLDEGLGGLREELREAVASLRPPPAEAEETVEEAEVKPEVVAPPVRDWKETLEDPQLLWGFLTETFGALRAELQMKDMLAIGIQLIILLRC